MKTCLALLALALLAATICASEPEPEPADISGVYSYSSSTATESFSGAVVIRPHGEGFSVAYTVYADEGTDGLPETMVGAGVRMGDTLAVGWAMPTAKGLLRGVTHYRIVTTHGRLRLTGRWQMLPGNGVTRSETLVFLGAAK